MRERLTSGQLALNESIPTLGHMAELYGEATAIAWLKIELDSVDAMLGATAFGELARKDASRMIYARYRDMNIGNLLQFFTRYKMGEYVEQTAHVGGVQKLMTALRLYDITRNDDAKRIERDRLTEAMYRQRLEWERRAISHEEYLKTKDEGERDFA